MARKLIGASSTSTGLKASIQAPVDSSSMLGFTIVIVIECKQYDASSRDYIGG